MSECNCGQWGSQGECVYCGEHYTDQWGKLQAENAKLQAWIDKAFVAHPNLDLDIEALEVSDE